VVDAGRGTHRISSVRRVRRVLEAIDPAFNMSRIRYFKLQQTGVSLTWDTSGASQVPGQVRQDASAGASGHLGKMTRNITCSPHPDLMGGALLQHSFA
jgi:hypothetical protein